MSMSTLLKPAHLRLHAPTGHAVTDGCLKVLESEEKIVNEAAGFSQLYKDLQVVQTFNGYVGGHGFFLLMVYGVIVAVIDYMNSDFVEMIAAAFVALMALFVTIFLGGDLFMFEELHLFVNNMEQDVKGLRAQIIFYEHKLEELRAVATGIESVHEQMRCDVTSTTHLLTDMEKLGKLQTVAAVMNIFFSADYDESGQISGQEAACLFDRVTFLWELVPGFEHSKVVEQVRENGLTIEQLSLILDALVVQDQSNCMKALQALCAQTDSFAMCESLDDRNSRDVESQPILAQYQEDAPPPYNTDEDMMKPLFTIPILFPVVSLGPVTIGGRCSLWGFLHLAALICVPINTAFFVLVVIGLEVQDIILQTVGVCLALGLTGAGKMIEVVRYLRREIKALTVETDNLKICNKNLASTVSKLQKLKLGMDRLQEVCDGNVEIAKKVFHESETKVKMEAMNFVTYLFKMADSKKDMRLVEDWEKEKFFASLEQVMHQVPGFNISVIRNLCLEDNITLKHIHEIVDAVASFRWQQPQEIN